MSVLDKLIIVAKVLFLVAVVLLVLSTVRAATAYSFIGGKWTDTITYDGDPLVKQALDEWGMYADLPPIVIDANHPALRMKRLSPWPNGQNVLGVAWIGGDGAGKIQVCEISVPNDTFYAVVLHEVGHCLGLGHSKASAIMYPACCNPITKDDIDGIQFLYGAPKPLPPPGPVTMRYRVIGVSRD